MSFAILGIILDCVVLIFLGITIYYAVKLTESLNTFRSTRQEFDRIMHNLNRNINDAHTGIDGLKRAAKETGQDLQKIISDSRKMAVQLETINEDAAKLLEQMKGATGGNLEALLEDPSA